MSDRRPHVVVVGGGLAGLAAALRCLDGGAAVTVFEARPRLGGATWSFSRHGLSFDNGQHVYLRCCTAYQRFLERVGSAGDAQLQERFSIPVLRARPGREPEVRMLERAKLPAPLHLAPSLARFSHLGLTDRARVGRAVLALLGARSTDAELDTESFAAFLSRHGQREAGIERLFDLVTLPTVNVRAAEASALLGTKVFRTGLLTEPEAADIGWARVPLTSLHGDAAERAIEKAGGTIRRGARVDAVARSNGANPIVTGVVVEGSVIEADAVVVAVPHTDVTPLVPAAAAPELAAVGDLGLSPIIDVHLVFDRKVSGYEMAAALDSPVQFVFDKTDASGLEGDGQCLSVSVSGADVEHGERPEVLIDRYRTAITELFPRAAGAKLVDAVVSREHEATFRGRAGTASLRPRATTRWPNLFLAGAWTDTGWPATMEGAVRSGNRAAWGALAATGRARAAQTEGEAA